MNIIKIKLANLTNLPTAFFIEEVCSVATLVDKHSLTCASKASTWNSDAIKDNVIHGVRMDGDMIGVAIGRRLHADDAATKLITKGREAFVGWLGGATAFGYTEGEVAARLRQKTMRALGI